MLKKKICIIEDEKDIVRLLTYNLNKEGYDVRSCDNGKDAFKLIKSYMPDLILLDIMIPVLDGFEVCKQLKTSIETKHTPIIIISAKTEESNIVTGLELGADDYITKPFSMVVLIARVRVALRRSIQENNPSETILNFNHLTIYPDRHEVFLADTPINFNHTEFKLLTCLTSRPGRVFTRLQIIDFMQGENYFVTQRLVDVLLVSIRKKLGVAAQYIQTVRGVGYKFKVY